MIFFIVSETSDADYFTVVASAIVLNSVLSKQFSGIMSGHTCSLDDHTKVF